MGRFILLVVSFVVAIEASMSFHGSTVTIGDASYFASPDSVAQLPEALEFISQAQAVSDFVPITVVDVQGSTGDLSMLLKSYLQQDDVLNQKFLQALYVKGVSSDFDLNCSSLAASGTSIVITEQSDGVLDAEAGPYLLSKSTHALHIPYRLYSDSQGAFSQGVIPGVNGSFAAIPASLPGASTITVGVPSRLYYLRDERPLAGIRLGVKDLYDLRGVKTGAGSRAYYDLYTEANTTAPAVQRLIDAGAVVVGKMKTTQFAMPEFAPLAIDYQAPVPAALNGVYGNRPSHDLVELTNAVPLAPAFDTAGFLVRDPALWHAAAETFGLPDPDASNLTELDIQILNFTDKLASYLSATTSTLDYDARWTASNPVNTSASLSDFVGYTWLALSAKEQIRLVRERFFADYAAKYNGRAPFVNPVANEYWQWGMTFNQTIDELTAVKTTFMQWWNSEIMPQNDVSCSDNLVIYISANALGVQGEPSYRYTQSGNLPLVSGLLGGLFIAPFAEVTDVVVPIGQVAYFSNVTLQEEYLPVTLNIMAAQGCDFMVLDLVNDLYREAPDQVGFA
ncbi:amidase signature domain-containing protein [Pestalotiopsis sp. NC0098]|nr:amidase signature domain-containing protein [Pestalotiopsis sp. NC0098]